MRRYVMHMTNQTFEELGEGLVRVTNPDRTAGVFTWQGRWIEGGVRDVNVNTLVYTGGPMWNAHLSSARRGCQRPSSVEAGGQNRWNAG
jgi:hypothetical protein